MSSHRAHLARGRGVVSLLCLAQHVAAFSVLASVPGLRSAGNSCRIPVLMCSGKEPQNRRAVISVAAGSAVGLLLSGTVLRLGSTEPAKAETSVEELAKLEHEELIKLAPEVQGKDRLRAWREEKEAREREARGQKPLPREVTAGDKKEFLPPITTAESSAEALNIGRHLKKIGAVMYGGYGCMHCFRQKQVLGKEVVSSLLTYVECGKNGVNTQRELCKEKGVKGFPTWEINGQLYPGEKSLADLAKLSNFDAAK